MGAAGRVEVVPAADVNTVASPARGRNGESNGDW
jgi:hypothetical protein